MLGPALSSEPGTSAPQCKSAVWMGEAVVITTGQESTETISELKIREHSKWYVEHLFAEFSST